MNENALTAPEVAQILNISPNTVYELVKRGELKCYRVGRKMRFTYADVKECIGQGADAALSPHENMTEKREKRNSSEGKDMEPAFIISGQDEILSMLVKYMERRLPDTRIGRIGKGSYDSLIALYKDEVQAAASHLWDSAEDIYNVTYLSKLVPASELTLVHVCTRMEGFFVAEGNPKKISGWEDLRRNDITIVNREPGAGARVLLDEHLKKLGVSGRSIKGYDLLCSSHMNVAGCVAGGKADLGIGTEKTASNIRGIEFIPLQSEEYDLVIKKENMRLREARVMLEILRDPDFQEQFAFLKGYDITDMGRVSLID